MLQQTQHSRGNSELQNGLTENTQSETYTRMEKIKQNADLNNIMKHLDSYRPFHPQQQNTHSCHMHKGIKTDHIRSQKPT